MNVYLAWYHNGFCDDGEELLGVYLTQALAYAKIAEHQVSGDRSFEHKGRASWRTSEHVVGGQALPTPITPPVRAPRRPRPKYTTYMLYGKPKRARLPDGWHRVRKGTLEAGDQTYWHDSVNPPTGFHPITVIPSGYSGPVDQVGKDVKRLLCVIRKD